MPLDYNRNLIPRAKEMRQGMTSQEQRLWFGFLRNYPVRFRRQVVIDHYIVDFYCAKAKLVIEVDGAQHSAPDAVEYDAIRTQTLEQLGLAVLRFPNHSIDEMFATACGAIYRAVQERI